MCPHMPPGHPTLLPTCPRSPHISHRAPRGHPTLHTTCPPPWAVRRPGWSGCSVGPGLHWQLPSEPRAASCLLPGALSAGRKGGWGGTPSPGAEALSEHRASRLPGAWSLGLSLRPEARRRHGQGTVHSLHAQLQRCGPFSTAEQEGEPRARSKLKGTSRKTNKILSPFFFYICTALDLEVSSPKPAHRFSPSDQIRSLFPSVCGSSLPGLCWDVINTHLRVCVRCAV